MLFYQTTVREKKIQTTKHSVSLNSLLASNFTHELRKELLTEAWKMHTFDWFCASVTQGKCLYQIV